jgi:hypothetical protein
LNGQESLETAKDRDTQAPIYVLGGVDTVVRQPAIVGDPASDTSDIAIPRFVQYSGYCDPARNAGVKCQGLRVPMSANGSAAWQGKLQYAYGAGAHISLTGLASRSQEREFPGTDLYNPESYAGTRLQSSAGILNWSQPLTHLGDGTMTLNVRLSYQTDQRISGPLTRQSDLDSRDPLGGFLLTPLDFLIDFNTTHDVGIAGTTYRGVKYLDDVQVRCVIVGEGFCANDVPYPNDNTLIAIMPYRLNPYGVEQGALFPFWSAGQDVGIGLARENRWQGIVGLDWQVNRIHRVRVGGELHRFDARRYQASMNSGFQIDAYHERPVSLAAYIEDRADMGDLVIVGGVRLDRFDSRARYPETPGRLFYPGPFDPNDPMANFVHASAHTALSPRLSVAYALTNHTIARASYGAEVQEPDFDFLFQAKNTDLSNTTSSQLFGRDIDFAKSVVVEMGIEHAFNPNLVLDVAAYHRERSSAVVGKLEQLPDPTKPAGPPGVFNTSNFIVLANAHQGHIRGVDVRLTQKLSGVFSGELVYGYQAASALPEGPTHSLTGSATLQIPDAWRNGSTIGTILENTSVIVSFQLTSGLRYAREQPIGAGFTTSDGPVFPIEPLGASRLPWTKTVDARVTRGLRLGRLDGTLFAEATNLLNLRNLIDLFTETGGVHNPLYASRFVGEQSAALLNEAAAVGLLKTDPVTGRPAVDLSQPGVCAGWVGRNSGGYASGPVDCVLLQRAEQRFGNGDGVFTAPEYEAAFAAWFNFANAPFRFAGPGRRIRVGVELSF